MSDKPANESELLELYRLHIEIADRESQRHEAANRLHAWLITVLGSLLVAILRLDGGNIPNDVRMGLLAAGIFFGLVLSLVWIAIAYAYRQARAKKREVLEELESKLAFPFVRREREICERAIKMKEDGALTVHDFLPVVFTSLFLAILVILLSMAKQ